MGPEALIRAAEAWAASKAVAMVTLIVLVMALALALFLTLRERRRLQDRLDQVTRETICTLQLLIPVAMSLRVRRGEDAPAVDHKMDRQ